MNWKNLRPAVELTAISVLAFAMHLLVFHFTAITDSGFFYALWQLYGFFFGCSLLIVLILIKVKKKNIDSVGNTFMLLTCIKMVLAYVLLHPILQAAKTESGIERTNFFIVFALFLTIETIVTIRLLNKS